MCMPSFVESACQITYLPGYLVSTYLGGYLGTYGRYLRSIHTGTGKLWTHPVEGFSAMTHSHDKL